MATLATVRPDEQKWAAYNVVLYEHKAVNAKITAIALGFIALFLIATSFMLFGVGTLPPKLVMGLGMFPYLAGALLSYLSLGLLCGGLVYAAIFAVRTCQKEQWQGLIKTAPVNYSVQSVAEIAS